MEEGGRNSDSGWDADFSGLTELALVAGVDVPFDVLFQCWPPEPIKESAACGIEPSMTQIVVGILDKDMSLRWGDIQLVFTVPLSPPKSAVE